MNEWKNFLTAFCTVSVLLGAISMLCPTGKLSKTVRYVLATIFLLTVLSAVPMLKISQTGKQRVQTENSETLTEWKIIICEQTFKTALAVANIEFREIKIDTDILPDGRIEIKKVTVYSSDTRDAVCKALDYETADYEVDVIHE